MYLRDIKLTNIKCFDEIVLSFVGKDGSPRRWTTLLGQNGCGKTTLLQAMAVALAGPDTLRDFGPLFDQWARSSVRAADIAAELVLAERDFQYGLSSLSSPAPGIPWQCRLTLGGEATGFSGVFEDKPALASVLQTVWQPRRPGYFCGGYGPYRRFSGISPDLLNLLRSGRRSPRLMTLFREDAAIPDLEEWIVRLHNMSREDSAESGNLLLRVRELMEQDFLPEPCSLDVTAASALISVGGRPGVRFDQLSDGYRSMLSLGLDLLRRLSDAFPSSSAPHMEPGVVLIDELDAHLHPRWQQTIGRWLMEKFPNLQFIVATHSPFLAQVSDEPGGNIVLEQQPDGTVTARTDIESVHTWRADQILTELFGLTSTRAPEVQAQLTEYLALEMKRRDAPLSSEESQRHQELETLYRAIPPPIEDPAERRRAEALRAAIEANKSKIAELE